MIRIMPTLFTDMFISLEKSIAVYELLHQHARGQTDLTEDQLANVVTGVTMQTQDVVRAVVASGTGGTLPLGRLTGWTDEALARAVRTTGARPHG